MSGFYKELHTDGSNAFIYSRFLIPWMCDWQGWALFLDGDMLVKADIAELWNRKRGDKGAQVVKHDYKTRYPVKYLGQRNEDYPRKNWSSVILWNCGYYPHRKLTPEFVSKQPGSFLHRFGWLGSDQIGDLDPTWNHLTMDTDPMPAAKLLHYTLGIPGFRGYDEQEGAAEWFDTADRMMAPMNGD